VQRERDPLGGSQRFDYHEQRGTDRVGEERFVLGIGRVLGADDVLGRVRIQRFLSPRLARTSSASLGEPSIR
jgi:hypothetical protein